MDGKGNGKGDGVVMEEEVGFIGMNGQQERRIIGFSRKDGKGNQRPTSIHPENHIYGL